MDQGERVLPRKDALEQEGTVGARALAEHSGVAEVDQLHIHARQRLLSLV